MGVPKYKPSKSRQRLRRTHDSLTAAGLVPCANCGLAAKPHHICPNCGHYRSKHGKDKTRLVIAQSPEA